MYEHKTQAAALAAQAFNATGVSTQERGRQKTLAVLQWVYRWRWTSPDLIPQIVGAQSRAFAASLVKKGLLCEVKTYAGTADGNPAKLLFLTKAGLRYLQNSDFYPSSNYSFGNRYNAKLLMHDLRVQRETLRWLQAERCTDETSRDYLSPYEFKEGLAENALGNKRPDAILLSYNAAGDIHLTALEVELTKKNADLLGKMLRQTLSMLAQGHVKAVVVLTPTKSICDAYRRVFAAGAPWSYLDPDTGITQHRNVKKAEADSIHVQTLGELIHVQIQDQEWLEHAAELRLAQ